MKYQFNVNGVVSLVLVPENELEKNLLILALILNLLVEVALEWTILMSTMQEVRELLL
jgi:hypothetical protein